MTTERRDGNEHPALAWVRANPALDSVRAGLSIADVDMNVHQYLVRVDRVGTRKLNNHMWVEVKTFGKQPAFAQQDTILIVGQLLHTGGGYKEVRAADGTLRKVRSWGYHLWTLSGTSPLDSEEMWWDRRPIDAATLEEVLTFRRDPDTLHPRSERRHHVLLEIQRRIFPEEG